MAVNLYAGDNSTFATSIGNWVTSQGTVARVADAGYEGTGYARLTTNTTGNINTQGLQILCSPGDVFSVEAYVRRSSATARNAQIMVQFLNDAQAQTGNFIGTAVALSSVWQVIRSLNATAPAGTTRARVQLRLVSGTTSDLLDFDDVFFNRGATVDRAPVGPAFKYWNGTSEVNATAYYWNGTSEVAINSATIS